jgi:hypothetical protein
VIVAAGAPVVQGRVQGEALRGAIHAALARLRLSDTALSWLGARGRARRGPGLRLARHLPQQAERLEGVAAGAAVGRGALLLAETRWRVGAVAAARPGGIAAWIDAAPSLAPLLLLRHSAPDAGGFASVELTAAPWAGALAGVNARGVAALCLSDQARSEPSLRFWVQELLYRGADGASALEHLRRRARYAGGSGRLLLAAADTGVLCLGLRAGALEVTGVGELPPRAADAVGGSAGLEIDLDSPRLRWAAQLAAAC